MKTNFIVVKFKTVRLKLVFTDPFFIKEKWRFK